MNEDIIKKAFENVKPPEELVDSVLSFKSDAQAVRRKKISAKRIFCTAAAACAILLCGITAAAGIIDFEAIFGDYIVVKDSELANSLMGTVKNFKYKVSDDDYKIEIKGVTGSDKSILGIAEISRVDGAPVTDSFKNPTEEKYLSYLWEHSGMETLGAGGGYNCYVNENGNIEYHFDISSGSNLIGKKFKVKSKNFYPNDAYQIFKEENNIYYMEWRDFSGYVKADESLGASYDDIVPADVDDSGIIALELEWEFSFTYKPSDAALKVKVCLEPEEDFIYYQTADRVVFSDGVGQPDPDGRVEFECAADCTYIEIGPMNGRIKFKRELAEYEKQGVDGEHYYVDYDRDKNELFLITSDGETIPVKFGGRSGSSDSKIFECDSELVYRDEDYKKGIIETENITAISVNGTVYELN